MAEASEKEVVFTIPLRKMKIVPYTIRANRAIIEIRKYIMRHMKTDEENVWIDTKVNEAIWSRSIQKPPSKIIVKAVKFEDGLVEVSLPDQ